VLGSAIGYFIFGLGGALWVLFGVQKLSDEYFTVSHIIIIMWES